MNPDYVSLLKQGLLRISGADAEGEVRVVEHSGHSFLSGRRVFLSNVQREKERILCDAFYEGCPGAHERLVLELSWSLIAIKGSQQRQRT